MYAIVEIAGKQYKVEKDQTLSVDRLNKNENDSITFDSVLLFADGENVQVGEPYLKNIKVQATVVGEKKGDKVRGVKFKKRKNYTRTVGHRTVFSQIRINDLVVS